MQRVWNYAWQMKIPTSTLKHCKVQWSEEQYLKLTDQTNRLIEFTGSWLYRGTAHAATERHQAVLEFLFLALRTFIEHIGGKVRFASLRVQLSDGKFREPDILLVLNASDPRRQNAFWLGADLCS